MKKSKATAPKPRRRIAIRPRITPGAPPGTLSPVPGSAPAKITVLTAAGNMAGKVREIADISTLPKADAKSKTSYWVRVTGLGDLAPLLALRDYYGLQNMAFEDMLNQGWRSKIEHLDEYLFFVLQSPLLTQEGSRNEHLCIFYSGNLIISFEESPTTLVDSLWQRLAASPVPAHIQHVAAYFVYAALDMVVDRFYPLLDKKDDALAELEESLDADG
ncbi:hypothetical protein LJC23_07745, partial [Desulfovibrio sp. OttesenSCG-928-I05]|nr:hypothetical protein [Desulfovibrio sp. OttesenSCG-928-I05]